MNNLRKSKQNSTYVDAVHKGTATSTWAIVNLSIWVPLILYFEMAVIL